MDTEPAAQFRSLVLRLSRYLNATATDQGLTPTQASVLGIIGARGPIGLGELAEIEGVNPTMLSRVVGKLDELGLLERTPDPDDLRTASVRLTARGASRHQRIRRDRTKILARCLDRLPKDARDRFIEALPVLESLAAELKAEATGTKRS